MCQHVENISREAKDHHGNSWDRFSLYLTIGDKHLKELESLILRITKPKGNRVKGKLARSENLKRKLTADIKTIQRAQLNGIIGRIVIVGKTEQDVGAGGRTPVLRTYISGPMKLRAEYKGKTYTGTIRHDGSIRVNRNVFTSPSKAGSAVTQNACDGWVFWKYERAPGDWVLLDELRK